MSARKREVQQLIADDEDIVLIEHNLSTEVIRVGVGFGITMNGKFQPIADQNYEVCIIQGNEYMQLMATTDTKPEGVFRPADLWPFIDQARLNTIAEREKAKKQQANEEEIAAVRKRQVEEAENESKNNS